MSKIVTTDIFIENSRKIHGNKYDYSNVEYLKAKSPVIIICPIHGEFKQQPSNHLSGKGCKICGNTKINSSKLNTTNFEIFKSKAVKLHNNKYIYEDIIDNQEKRKSVLVICPIHGKFKQLRSNHLKGHGCKKCQSDKQRSKDFISKSKIKHNNFYFYDKVEYISGKQRVIIECPNHGDFLQYPDMHLKGHGCPKCAGNNKLTTELFIDKSIKKHGDRYDYSKSHIKNSKTPVLIICKNHGEFYQTPTTHYIKGSGCPECNLSKGEEKVKSYLESKNLLFISQKKFENCKHVNELPFDFYLPEHNLIIEYDGQQHFKIDGFINKTNEDLLLRKKCDKIKNKFCKNNNITIIRISYLKYNDIENILSFL